MQHLKCKLQVKLYFLLSLVSVYFIRFTRQSIMHQLCTLILWVTCCLCQSVSSTAINDDWATFKVKYNRTYSTFQDKIREEIYRSNVNYIIKHNLQADAGEHTYWLKVNKFADLTPSEYMTQQLGYRGENRLNLTGNSTYSAMGWPIDDEIDWRTKNIVNLPRDQSSCASDWAIASISVIESQVALITGSLPTLSVQQLIDCSSDYNNYGCRGGVTENAFKYIKDTGGINSQQLYPTTSNRQMCKFNRQEAQSHITGFVVVRHDANDESLKDAVANVGPIASVIDASDITFQFYSHGIYQSSRCKNESSNHAVIIIGYGREENNQNYWLIQNTWGEDWGEKGIFKLNRDISNNCGISNHATYPLV